MKRKTPVELAGTDIDDVRGGTPDTIQIDNPGDPRVLGSDGSPSDNTGYSEKLRYTGGYTTTQ